MFAGPNPEALHDIESEAEKNQRRQQLDREASQLQQTQTTVNVQGKPIQGGSTDPVKPGATPSSPPPPGTRVSMSRAMNWGTFQLMIALFAFIVMIISSQICTSLPTGEWCLGTRAFQVCAGAISGIVAFFTGLANLLGYLENKVAQLVLSWFQFLWWVASVIVLTFFGDFTSTILANGYYGSWAAFFFALFSLLSVSPWFENQMDRSVNSARTPIFVLGLASAVEMGAAIGPCSPQSVCGGENAFAVCAGAISLAICLCLICAPVLEKRMMQCIGVFFILWWIIATCIFTFSNPFRTAGNGYFASFAAILASIWISQVSL